MTEEKLTWTSRDDSESANRWAAPPVGHLVLGPDPMVELREIRDRINVLLGDAKPVPERDPEVPAWPTAPLVVADGTLWWRDKDGNYDACADSVPSYLIEDDPEDRNALAKAIPVTVVPTATLNQLAATVAHDNEAGVPTAAHERLWQRADAVITDAKALGVDR